MEMTLPLQQELPQLAASQLREMILEKQLQPGDRFPSESEMVKMFGVGRSTIREAVKILVTENVVEIRRGKGTFITQRPGVTNDPLGLHFADQSKLLYNLFETRMIVEPRIAYLAAERAAEQDIRTMETIVHEFCSLTVEGSGRFSVVDVDFHTVVARATQNDVLYRFLPSICESIREGRYKTINNEASHKRAQESHMLIFQAIKNRQPDIASRETDKHIRQTAKDAGVIL